MFCISVTNKEKCTGCTVCFNICPVKAITMEFDHEGFLYPVINKTVCNKCGLCYIYCPEINLVATTKRPEYCYAATHSDEKILMQSASGGAFSAIVQSFNNRDTIIFGAVYDTYNRVCHQGGYSEAMLPLLRQSKYVQSDIRSTFIDVWASLTQNKQVVFSGTPCQIAGLKAFLRTDFENLFCVEILCHGVASPKVFSEYLNALEEKQGQKILKVTFRNKKQGKGMWEDFLTTFYFKDGIIISDRFDLFTQGFLQRLFLRKCCESCAYAKEDRVGDVVVADFWGLKNNRPDLFTNKGVSLIIPITNKANNVIEKMKDFMVMNKLNIELAIEGNRVLQGPAKANDRRNDFFRIYMELGVIKALATYVYVPPKLRRWLSYLPEPVKKVIRRCKRVK